MASPAEVTWVETDPSGARILKIGGTCRTLFGKSGWELSEAEAIALVEQDEWIFYVDIGDRKEWLELNERSDGSKTLSADGPIKRLM